MKYLFSLLQFNYFYSLYLLAKQSRAQLDVVTFSIQTHPCDYTLFSFQGLDSNLPMDQRRYINPGNYPDLMELLQTFTTEVDRSKTKLNGLIGQGTVLYHCFAVPIFKECENNSVRIPFIGSREYSESIQLMVRVLNYVNVAWD